jgi:hypothetical protein
MFDGALEAETAAAFGLSRQACTPAQLVRRIGGYERLIAAAQAEQLRDIAALADAQTNADVAAGLGPRLAGRTVAAEVACARGVTPATGRHHVELATAAVTDHPRLLDCLAAGRVSLAALRRVAEETVVLDSHQRREVDANLAADAFARRLTPTLLRRAAAAQVIGADPTAAMKRCARERADRRVSVLDKHHGTAAIWAKLRAEEAVAVHDVLDGEARSMRTAGDARTLADLMCDVLVHRVTSPNAPTLPLELPSTDSDDRQGPPRSRAPRRRAGRARRRATTRRVEIQVVMAASTLIGVDDAPALLRGYGAIPAELAQHIADHPDSDPVLRRLVCDPVDGRLLAADAGTRCYEGPLRRFELCRDQHSRFPFSSTPIADVDHIREHADGGPTTAGNGQGLDKGSHILREHPGVTVTALPTTTLDELRANAPTIRWTLPSGHSYDSHPPPALGWGTTFTEPPKAKPDLWSPLECRYELAIWRHQLRRPPPTPRPPRRT